LYYIPDPPFLLHAILETALTHLRSFYIFNAILFLYNQKRMQQGNTKRNLDLWTFGPLEC